MALSGNEIAAVRIDKGVLMLYLHNMSRGFRFFLCFAVCFAVIAALVHLDKVTFFDDHIIIFIQSAVSPQLTSVAKFLSLIGSSKLAIGISLFAMAILYVLLKHRLELILLVWVELGSLVLNTLMKLWFHRERPDLHRLIEEVGYSFPSGHSMAAFSLYGVLAYLLWRHLSYRYERVGLIMVAIFITLGIGWSRIYLGVHYPSDVIGGYAASGAWLMLSIGLFEGYKNLRGRNRL